MQDHRGTNPRETSVRIFRHKSSTFIATYREAKSETFEPMPHSYQFLVEFYRDGFCYLLITYLLLTYQQLKLL